MKKKIQEVQDYFRNKIVKGQYKVQKFNEHTTDIVIDKSFEFKLWTANEDYALSVERGTVEIQFTDKERSAAWKKIKKHLDKNHQEVTLTEKKKQLEELKKELGED